MFTDIQTPGSDKSDTRRSVLSYTQTLGSDKSDTRRSVLSDIQTPGSVERRCTAEFLTRETDYEVSRFSSCVSFSSLNFNISLKSERRKLFRNGMNQILILSFLLFVCACVHVHVRVCVHMFVRSFSQSVIP